MKRALPILFVVLFLCCGVAQAVKECDLIIGQEVHGWISTFPPSEQTTRMNQYLDCLRPSVDKALSILHSTILACQQVRPYRNFMSTYNVVQGQHESLKSNIVGICMAAGGPGTLDNGYCLVQSYLMIKMYYRRLGLLIETLK